MEPLNYFSGTKELYINDLFDSSSLILDDNFIENICKEKDIDLTMDVSLLQEWLKRNSKKQ